VQRSYKENDVGPVTEMAIVNTFTKLIFGDEDYSERESLIIDAFRMVNPDVHCDNHQEMGEYLRNLGVREMIQMVLRVRQHMTENIETPETIANQATPGVSIRPLGQGPRGS